MRPENHRIYDFHIYTPGDKEPRLLSSMDRKGKTMWRILSEYGKRVIVMNVPQTYPPEKVNGLLISGFMTPSEDSNFTYPPALREELLNLGYKIEMNPKVYNDAENKDPFINEVRAVMEKRKRVALYLMKKYKWDFFLVVFDEPDRVQHFFWRYIDPNHPRYDPEGAKKYGKVIEWCYQQMDGVIGEMLKNVGKNTTVIIFSDHGHGAAYKLVSINKWLMDLGLLKLKKERYGFLGYKYFLDRLNITRLRIHKFLYKHGLTKVAVSLSRVLPKRVQQILPFEKTSIIDCDWSKTVAYSYGCGKIYINHVKRSSVGIVKLNKEYRELRGYLTEKLHEFRDPETGTRIVKKVNKCSTAPYAPDLVIVLNDTYVEDSGIRNKVVEICRPKSGTHALDGVLIMSGPKIKPNSKLKNAKIIDVVPSILRIFELPLPKTIDGRVLKEIFKTNR
jgi:predicted AlkP superfamily phosphohydrolase/phosphomutase